MTHQQAILKAAGAVAVVLVIGVLIALGVKAGKEERMKVQAMRNYCIRTGAHLEKYVSGSHWESKYVGTVVVGVGDDRREFSQYTPVKVDEYSYKFVYPDGRTVYPEENFDWTQDLHRLKNVSKR